MINIKQVSFNKFSNIKSICTNWHKWVQTGTNGYKWVQTGTTGMYNHHLIHIISIFVQYRLGIIYKPGVHVIPF